MRKLTNDQALDSGIQTVYHQMDNGELRFRLTRDTGSSYILTLSAKQSGWQFSHVHHQKREFYIVEQGWIVIALRQAEQLTFRRLGPDDSFMLPPGMPHNVYLSEGTVLHTVKYGSTDVDWEAAPELDDQLRHETFDGKTFLTSEPSVK